MGYTGLVCPNYGLCEADGFIFEVRDFAELGSTEHFDAPFTNHVNDRPNDFFDDRDVDQHPCTCNAEYDFQLIDRGAGNLEATACGRLVDDDFGQSHALDCAFFVNLVSQSFV